jgi:pimeloyl-ACP methyl ester carboxylesterase
MGIRHAALAGFSMGGRIISHLASLEPGLTRCLVLSNSSLGPLPKPPGARERIEEILKNIREGAAAQMAENSTRMAFSPGLKERDPAAWDLYYRMNLTNNPAGRLGLTEASLTSELPDTDLSRIKCPVLMVQGETDVVIPAAAREQSYRLVKDAQLIVLPTGHASALEASADWNRVVMEFLASVP